jgi:hypothetical protein
MLQKFIDYVNLDDRRVKISFWFFLITSLFFTYWNVIRLDNLLMYDDSALVNPLTQIKNIKDYVEAFNTNLIYDIQPVRDLSLIIDIYLKSKLSFWGFHLTNLILWFGILFNNLQILKKLKLKPIISYLIILFLAFSMANTTSVAWISARKHLLSTLIISFVISICLNNLNEKKLSSKKILLILFLFFLAMFTHPLYVGLPVWILIYLYLQKNLRKWLSHKENILTIILLFGFSLFISLINHAYYTTKYLEKSNGFEKYLHFPIYEKVAFILLSVGRYFFESVFPFRAMPFSFYNGAIENMIGLVCLPLFCWITYRLTIKEYKRYYWIGVFTFLMPISIVTINQTNIFCSDTYLLLGSLGVWIIIGFAIQSRTSLKKATVILSMYVLLVGIYNYKFVQLYQNSLALFTYNYRADPNFVSISNMILLYNQSGRLKEARPIIDELERFDSENYTIGEVRANNIYGDNSISMDTKLQMLLAIKQESALKEYFISRIYVFKNNKVEFYKHALKVFKSRDAFMREISPLKEDVFSFYKFSCEFFNIKEKCINEIHKYRFDPKLKNFDQKKYDETYRDYLKLKDKIIRGN